MPPGGVIRAVDHPYRRNILHILAREARTYSQLFASMEPQGGGRGRFNYHLKVLRQAGLIEAQDNHYGLSETGEAAVSFLEEVNRDSNPRVRPDIPRRQIGLRLGVLTLALATALLLWSILAPPMTTFRPVQPLEAGWGTPTAIETGEEYTQVGSRVHILEDIQGLSAVVDSADNGLVAWTQIETIRAAGGLSESTVLLRSAQFVPGVGWGGIISYEAPWKASLNVRLATGEDVNVRLAIGEDGSIFALWSTVLGEVYASRLGPSGEWATPTLLDQGEAHRVHLRDIEANSLGRAIATWAVGSETYGSYFSGLGWESPVSLGPREGVHGTAYYVDVAMNPEGDAVAITWFEPSNGTGPGLWARIFEASRGWQPPVFLGKTTGRIFTMDEWSEALASLVEAIGEGWPSIHLGRSIGLVVDHRGDVVAVWEPNEGYGGGNAPIFRTRSVQGSGWTAPDLVVPSPARLCDVEGIEGSDVLLLWKDQNERDTIYADSYARESSWTGFESGFTYHLKVLRPAGLIEAQDHHDVFTMSSPVYRCPHLAAAPTGNALAVSSDGKTIWANYFVRPQPLEDVVEDVGDLVESGNAKLAGLELRFLFLAGAFLGLLAFSAILLSLYWHQRREPPGS